MREYYSIHVYDFPWLEFVITETGATIAVAAAADAAVMIISANCYERPLKINE